ncbi:MAG TPA: hypothetical protein VGA92_00440 [Candidatus Nitrosotenuis sp.]
MQSCNDICQRYRARQVTTHSKYGEGQKWCSVCSIFLVSDTIRCPCCNIKLRTKARVKKRMI